MQSHSNRLVYRLIKDVACASDFLLMHTHWLTTLRKISTRGGAHYAFLRFTYFRVWYQSSCRKFRNGQLRFELTLKKLWRGVPFSRRRFCMHFWNANSASVALISYLRDLVLQQCGLNNNGICRECWRRVGNCISFRALLQHHCTFWCWRLIHNAIVLSSFQTNWFSILQSKFHGDFSL